MVMVNKQTGKTWTTYAAAYTYTHTCTYTYTWHSLFVAQFSCCAYPLLVRTLTVPLDESRTSRYSIRCPIYVYMYIGSSYTILCIHPLLLSEPTILS